MRFALACMTALVLHVSQCTVGESQVGTQYNGISGNLTLPGTLTIASMSGSGTNPTLITFTGPHGMTTGDQISIYNVDGNTAANGQWPVTVTSAVQISIPVAGNGTYTASVPGIGKPLTFGSTFQIPSDGDLISGANANIAPESIGDRSALLITKIGAYKLVAEGTVSVDDPTLISGWATINSSVTSWTAATSGPTRPIADILGLLAGDRVELELSFYGVNSSSSQLSAVSFGYAEVPPGASVGAYQKLPGSGTAVFSNNLGGDHHIIGTHTMAGANSLAVTVGQTITAAVTHINALSGDFTFRYRVFRATGVNQ